jgi:tetratricopeptide (TPR) repeat protein
MRSAFCRRAAAIAIVLVASTPVKAADGSIDEAKALYAAASFDNALAVISGLAADASNAPEVLEYKALCLLALGRTMEAQSAVDGLVSTFPAFVPAKEDVSPRFLTLFSDSRRRLLPDVTRKQFAAARELFRAKNLAAAKEQFQAVLDLADDPSWRQSSDAEDVRTLASAFIELANAAPTAAASRPTTSSAPSTVIPRQTTQIQPAVAIEQTFPNWRPTDGVTALRRYAGAVNIRIGKDGQVISATIHVATDPEYDKQLLLSTRSWRYKPAMRNGEPIESDKVVTYLLRLR